MMQFIELLHPKPRLVDGVEVASPRRSNEERTALFAQIVEVTPGLHPWSGDTTQVDGTRLVIGAVTWSSYDLRALDELVAADLTQHGFRVDVFDIDLVFQEKGQEQGRDACEERIPGIGDFQVTPILGVWENGVQIKTASGFLARKILAEYVQNFMPAQPYNIVYSIVVIFRY